MAKPTKGKSDQLGLGKKIVKDRSSASWGGPGNRSVPLPLVPAGGHLESPTEGRDFSLFPSSRTPLPLPPPIPLDQRCRFHFDQPAENCPSCKEDDRLLKALFRLDEEAKKVKRQPRLTAEERQREERKLRKQQERLWKSRCVLNLPPLPPPISPAYLDLLEEQCRLVQEWEEKRNSERLTSSFIKLREVFGLSNLDFERWNFVVLKPRYEPPALPEPAPVDNSERIRVLRQEIAMLATDLKNTTKKNLRWSDKLLRKERRRLNSEISECEREIKELKNEERRVPIPPVQKPLSVPEILTRDKPLTFGDLLSGKAPRGWSPLTFEEIIRRDKYSGRWSENQIIQWAIVTGIFEPIFSVRQAIPWLRWPKRLEEVLDREVDETENALIKKSGGTVIGGSIRGRGQRFNPGSGAFVERELETFDMPLDLKIKGGELVDAGEDSSDDTHSDDYLDNVDSNEDSE